MTPTGRGPGQTFLVVQDKCAHNTASDKADDEALSGPRSASKNELRFRSEYPRVTDHGGNGGRCVVSYHRNACRIAPSERGRAHSPDSG